MKSLYNFTMGPVRDKRLFKRYRQKTDFSLTIGSAHYRASTVDFSLSGLCIFIEGTPAVTLNSTVSLKIDEMGLDIQANVVWVQRTDANLLVGLQKMSISGLLKYYPLSDILLDLQRSDSTGTLEIRNDPACKQIFLKNGTMVFAASNSEEDRIEEILLRSHKITNDQYYQLASIAEKSGKLQGKVLVEMGYIEPRDLFVAVRHQCEEIILSLFPWEDGHVNFVEGPLPYEIPALKLNAANLIFHGIKRIHKPEYFQSVCPPPDTILYYSEEPINLFQDIQFTEKDQYVFSLIDSKITMSEMLSVSTLGQFMTMKIVSALLSTRMIVPIGKGFVPDKSIVKIIREPRKSIDSAFIEKVEQIFKRLGSMDYYDILGISRKAPQDEVKKAFYRCAKEFHPDRHFGVSSEALKVRLNAIFAFINDAHRVLSDSAERDRYDRTLSGSASKPEINNTEVARVKFQEGRASFRKGLYEEAAVLFGQAVYFDGSVADYHFYLGSAYAKQNKLRESEKAINKALEIDPGNAEYMAKLGELYLTLGFKSRARSTFEKAIKIDPSNKKAQEGLKWA